MEAVHGLLVAPGPVKKHLFIQQQALEIPGQRLRPGYGQDLVKTDERLIELPVLKYDEIKGIDWEWQAMDGAITK